jgi:thioesterase domain-containing protein
VTPLELQRYLHEHIPLSRAMQVAVIGVDPAGVILSAPLAPNINHRETVFGGSASAVATLAAWALVHIRLLNDDLPSRIVIQRNTMNYDQPMSGAFTAQSFLADPEAWPRFTQLLRRRGKARIAVFAHLLFAGQVAGRFEGEFVAL